MSSKNSNNGKSFTLCMSRLVLPTVSAIVQNAGLQKHKLSLRVQSLLYLNKFTEALKHPVHPNPQTKQGLFQTSIQTIFLPKRTREQLLSKAFNSNMVPLTVSI